MFKQRGNQKILLYEIKTSLSIKIFNKNGMDKFMKTKLLLLIIYLITMILFLTCIADAIVVTGNDWIVASRNPEAAETGALIFQQGGNAFDAVVAGLAVLGVVDPLMSGLGAEVFALAYSAEENKVISINGGGTTAQANTLEWYFENSKESLKSPLMTGLIPGAFDAWIILLDKWGVMRLAEVLAPAVHLAEGWAVSEKMAQIFTREEVKEKLFKFASSKEIYYKKDGSSYLSGEIMVNKDLAHTMKRLITIEDNTTTWCPCRGPNNRHQALRVARDYFYKVTIAKEISDFCSLHGHPISYFDLILYHALIETPAQIKYHGYDIYKPPSANQGPIELEALNIIEELNLASLEHNTAQSIHLMAEALNLARADGEKYLGDFNFLEVPLRGLLSKEYAQKRKTLIDFRQKGAEYPAGNPLLFNYPEWIYDGEPLPRYLHPRSIEFDREFSFYKQFPKVNKSILIQDTENIEDIFRKESNYVCAADKWGNLVYITTTLTSPFGTGAVIEPLGFLLNSGGERFHLEASHINAPAPGKRPISKTSPTMICKDGKPYLTFGASNGDGEPQTLVQTLVNIIDYKMDIQKAVDAPMWRSYSLPASKTPFTANSGGLSIDKRVHPEIFKKLEEMGWRVTIGKEFCNNPECLIMIDQEQGTLRVVIASNKANTVIAR